MIYQMIHTRKYAHTYTSYTHTHTHTPVIFLLLQRIENMHTHTCIYIYILSISLSVWSNFCLQAAYETYLAKKKHATDEGRKRPEDFVFHYRTPADAQHSFVVSVGDIFISPWLLSLFLLSLSLFCFCICVCVVIVLCLFCAKFVLCLFVFLFKPFTDTQRF